MMKNEILESELHEKAQFLKETKKGGNLIYRFSAYESPPLMEEVGRLRELAFRNVGGGTGKEVDIDEYDSDFDQLVVWSPKDKKIIGGYRIQKMRILDFNQSPLYHFFRFSEKFSSEYAPYAVELGRSFIIPELQNSRSGVFALDNLFDAIGAWVARDQSIKYLVGKITIYPMDPSGKSSDLSVVYEAINKYFTSSEGLMTARSEFKLDKDIPPSGELSGDLKKDLNTLIRRFHAPPLLSVYAGLSPSMQTFGTVSHIDFGNTEETAMMLTINDIYPDVRERYNF